MDFSLTFNNKTNNDLGLKIVSRSDFPSPTKNAKIENIPARNAGILFDEGTFKESTISVDFNFSDYSNINDTIRKIHRWLNNLGNGILTFSDDHLFFRKVIHIEYEDIKRSLKFKGSFKVNFIIEPFFYYLTNPEFTLSGAATGSFTSPNMADNSDPIIELTGTGNIDLTINHKTFHIKSLNGKIILNSVIKEAYSDSFANLNSITQGEFLTLSEGTNTVSITGTYTSLKIIPNWRIIG